MRTYSELIKLKTFRERYEYLKLNGSVGEETFGIDRYLNQKFYRSDEWRNIRNKIIIRDNGCDLADPERPLDGRVYIHHMNPITVVDVIHHSDFLVNPDYLVCCSYDTHQAIHFGNEDNLFFELVERKPYDTCPWRK